jgi:transcriptional regulator with XRE-family HTH domain
MVAQSRLQSRIGRRLRQAREQADLSQKAAAAKLGIKAATLAGWESGTHAPRTATLHTMCRLYRCSADYLLDRVEDPSGLQLAGSNEEILERLTAELLARARKAAATVMKKANSK